MSGEDLRKRFLAEFVAEATEHLDLAEAALVSIWVAVPLLLSVLRKILYPVGYPLEAVQLIRTLSVYVPSVAETLVGADGGEVVYSTCNQGALADEPL